MSTGPGPKGLMKCCSLGKRIKQEPRREQSHPRAHAVPVEGIAFLCAGRVLEAELV